MAKDKAERIRDLLEPRETVLYQAETHPAAYTLPVIAFLLGAAVMFLVHGEIVAHLPATIQAAAADSLQGAQDTSLGFWMMGIGALFGFRLHMDAQHLIQIVTNRRVVQVKGNFLTETHALPLHYISEVKIKYGTVWNRLMHRGNVIMKHKKDVRENIVFSGVNHPEMFVEHLRMAQERYGEALVIQERFEKGKAKHS